MYIDVIVIVILLAVLFFFFRRFSSVVYGIAIIDIFLRILTFVKNNSGVPELKTLIDTYFPESIAAIIGKYSSDMIYSILMWIYVVIFAIFLGYTIQYFVKKRK